MINQLSNALNDLKNINIFHRDIKPSNILRFDNNHYCLVDFSVAEYQDSEKSNRRNFSIYGNEKFFSPQFYQYYEDINTL